MTPPPNLQQLIDTVRRDAGTDDAIALLRTAAAAAAELEETTDALLGHFVDRCRRDGRSWSEISAALGVTKQAVHKRFATAVADQLIAAIPAPTLDRFTPRARNVLSAARQAALASGASEVGSQHVLLGLFTEPDGIAARVLSDLGVTRESAQEAVRAADPQRESAPAASSERVSATPRYAEDGERALRDALAVALELGHNYIGTEHMLLGLYRNAECLAAGILAGLGTTEDAARTRVLDRLQGFTTSG